MAEVKHKAVEGAAMTRMVELVRENRKIASHLNTREARLEAKIEEVCAVLEEERIYLRSTNARFNRVARRTGMEI